MNSMGVQQMQELLAVSQGRKEGDLLVRDVQILDVFTETVFAGDILIYEGRIASIQKNVLHKAKEVMEGKGLIAVPGFIDAHFHLDFPLVTPAELAKAIVPRGTTAMVCEILDFAALNGLESTKILVKDAELLPYRCYWAAPGKVAPKFITEEILGWENTVALGEMAQGLVESAKPDELDKICQARRKGKVISGHVIRRSAEEMETFAILGYADEHNTDTFEETLDRMRYGMSKIVRMNGVYHAADSIITGCLQNGIPTDKLMFSADDVYVHEVFRSGHIDSMVQRCIELGLPAAKAIKMATLNAACHFGLEQDVGSITPGRFADVVFLKSLETIRVEKVIQNGRLVCEDNRLTHFCPVDYSALEKKAEPGLINFSDGEFLFKGKECVTTCYTLLDNTPVQINTKILPTDGAQFPFCPQEDELPFYRIERYPTFGKRKVDKKLVKGTGIRKGAVALSFEQGGSAISAVGASPKDLFVAVKEADKHAGALLVVVDGVVEALLSLPIGGCLSALDAYAASAVLENLECALAKTGCTLQGALMRLYFLPFYFGMEHGE